MPLAVPGSLEDARTELEQASTTVVPDNIFSGVTGECSPQKMDSVRGGDLHGRGDVPREYHPKTPEVPLAFGNVTVIAQHDVDFSVDRIEGEFTRGSIRRSLVRPRSS